MLPYRVSVGYTGQQGILKTSQYDRYTASLNLNPSLLNDHLTMNLNAKGMYSKNHKLVNIVLLLTLCNLKTESCMEAQVFETMYLIIDVCTTDE